MSRILFVPGTDAVINRKMRASFHALYKEAELVEATSLHEALRLAKTRTFFSVCICSAICSQAVALDILEGMPRVAKRARA